MSLSGFWGSSPLITFILISFKFLMLIILRTPLPVFFPCRILSFPLLPRFRCKLNLVADLATPRISWLCLLICIVLWMVPPFLSFPHIPFLALLGSICLPSVLIIMVFFFQTHMFSPIIVIPQVLRFVKTQGFACTIIIPDVRPRRFWWPLFQSYSSFLLASQGSPPPPPPPQGYSSSWPLPWDLWVFRIVPVSDLSQ